MSLLDDLFRAGALRSLDHALAQSLRRLDPATPDTVLAGAALASLAVAHGHAGFDPARPRTLVDGPFDWPAPDEWRDTLAGSSWVSTPGNGDPDAKVDWDVDADTDATAHAAPEAAAGDRPVAGSRPAPEHTPLVLEGGLLYLRRYREYERRLALRLQAIAAQPPAGGDIAALAPLFAALFPHARGGETGERRADGGTTAGGDRQARAAALALLRSLLLITGGPGTGKTTTITRLLLLLVAQAAAAGAPTPRIALAAPTGRAAERMAESLRQALAPLRATPGIDAGLCDRLPTAASTLHRLLGTVPGRPDFRHGADHPLPFDVVVVDEASMVDLPLMCKLAEAVADGARLILLGDRDQLPSVEAGDVLAAIVDAATEVPLVVSPAASPGIAAPRTASPADVEAQTLALLLGEVPADDAAAGAGGLHGHRVQLRRGYRQAASFDLAPLAAAVRTGDADQALTLLREGSLAGVHFHENRLDPLETHRDALLGHWRDLAGAADPARALRQAGRLRLLTALREGPQGARGLNARIEEALAGRSRTGAGYFQGRLLLVTENSYRHRLFNGDIGICLRDASGAMVAWFAGADEDRPGEGGEGVRGFHPAALPAHDSAFAMTVHKAQGSEFDSVWLQLPRQDNRVLSRELVYTALTRAKAELHLCASEAVLRAALARHATRMSGLAWRLGRPPDIVTPSGPR